MGDAQLTATASMPAKATKLVSTLGFGSTATLTGTATAAVCATAAACGLPDAAAAQIPHWSQLRFAANTPGTSVTKYTWAAPGSALTVPVPQAVSDIEHTDALTFRMTPDVTVDAVSDLAVTVMSKGERPVTVRASDYSAAPTALPGSAPYLNKVLLRGVRIPVTDLVALGLDPNHVEAIALSGLGDSGGTFLADLAFSSSAAGTTASSHTLPVLTIADRHVNEGSGPGSAEIAIRLNSKPRRDVTGYFELHNFDDGAASGETHTPFTIPRGDTCVTITVPLNGNTLPATEPTSKYIGTVSLIGGAITGDNNARLVVREDDAVIIDGEEQPLAPEPAPEPLCG
jgi:trimeric autotransporter adhesin